VRPKARVSAWVNSGNPGVRVQIQSQDPEKQAGPNGLVVGIESATDLLGSIHWIQQNLRAPVKASVSVRRRGLSSSSRCSGVEASCNAPAAHALGCLGSPRC